MSIHRPRPHNGNSSPGGLADHGSRTTGPSIEEGNQDVRPVEESAVSLVIPGDVITRTKDFDGCGPGNESLKVGIKSVRYDGSMPVPALSCFQRSGLNPTAANTLRRNTMTANTTASISLAILVSLACSLPVLASQPSIERLDSGLRIVFFPDPSSSVFVSSVVVLAGSAQEPDAQRGSAHFLEHLLFGKSLSRSR